MKYLSKSYELSIHYTLPIIYLPSLYHLHMKYLTSPYCLAINYLHMPYHLNRTIPKYPSRSLYQLQTNP